jgi:ATP-dependent RNA helicase SUPV3L1/SUV3
VRRLEAEGDEAFSLGDDRTVLWHGATVGRLAPGPDLLTPAVRLLPSDLVEPGARDRIVRRLQRWLAGVVAAALQPLMRLREAELTGTARGIAFQLVEALGNLPRAALDGLIGHLSKPDRKALARLGVRFGTTHVFVQPALKPRAMAMRALLWTVANRPEQPPPLPPPGSQSVPLAEGVPPAFYRAVGYEPAGARALRVDRLEALAAELGRLHRQGPVTATVALAQLVGLPVKDLPMVLAGLGWRAVAGEDGTVAYRAAPVRGGRGGGKAQAAGESAGKEGGKGGAKARPPKAARPESPFAKLKLINGAR